MPLVAICAVGVAGAALFRRRRRHREGLERMLPVLATDLARSVRSGATLHAALADATGAVGSELGADLAAVIDATTRGRRLGDALEDWRIRRNSPGVDLLVRTCRFGAGYGGDLSVALDGVAAALLDAAEVADETAALTSQARASVWVLVSLPPAGALVLATVDPAVAGVLTGTAVGWVCLAAGAFLDATGAALSMWLVRRATR
jgi:tight adherence protein B